MPKLTPHQQFKNEHRAMLNRWLEESDIDDHEMAQIALTDVEEWCLPIESQTSALSTPFILSVPSCLFSCNPSRLWASIQFFN